MTTIFEGQPLPSITSTMTPTVPDWYTNPVSQASQIASSQMGTTTTGADGKPVFTPKTAAQGLAAQDPLQLQGYAATPGAASSYIPGLTSATQTAGQAASAMNPAGIQQFMNPYINSVTNEQARLANQNFQRNVLPALSGQFVGTGGLGSQRYASALGQTGADFQANLTGQQNKSLADAYKSALDASYNQGQLQNAVAQTQGTLAGKEQEYGLKGASALTAAGAANQTYKQSVLDYPLTNAVNSMKVLSGLTIPQGKTEVGPKTKDYYGLSDLSKVQTLGGLLKSAEQGKFGTTVADAFSKLISGDFSGIRSMSESDINALYGGLTPDERDVAASLFEY